ncbi:MAG: hypothetical protein ACE5HJ_07425 [Thermoplasmata archaeon]
MDLADVGVLLWERRGEMEIDLLDTLMGREALRQTAEPLPDAVRMEYGWLSRQQLKAWIRELGWIR